MSPASNRAAGVEEISAEERPLVTAVARRFYIDDASKVEIATEFGLSRFKVARLLEQARTTGIVTITLDDGGFTDDAMSEELRSHLQLSECVVVSAPGNEAEGRRHVGRAAATLLTHSLTAGDVLGLAWGRTLTAMTRELLSLPSVSVVQLTGALGSDPSESPVEVVRIASQRAGGSAHSIFAPLLLDDAVTASALRRQTDVAEAISLFNRVTVAMVAVGSWDPPISQIRDSLSDQDLATLAPRGVQAEVCGILIDQNGKLVGADFAERCLAITATQLANIPRIIAVAAGAPKARAVRAVAKAKLMTGLVTDRSLAQALLELPAG